MASLTRAVLRNACGVFRVLGRPDPGPADTAMMLPVAWVIGGALLVMGIILIIADLVSPVRLF